MPDPSGCNWMTDGDRSMSMDESSSPERSSANVPAGGPDRPLTDLLLAFVAVFIVAGLGTLFRATDPPGNLELIYPALFLVILTIARFRVHAPSARWQANALVLRESFLAPWLTGQIMNAVSSLGFAAVATFTLSAWVLVSTSIPLVTALLSASVAALVFPLVRSWIGRHIRHSHATPAAIDVTVWIVGLISVLSLVLLNYRSQTIIVPESAGDIPRLAREAAGQRTGLTGLVLGLSTLVDSGLTFALDKLPKIGITSILYVLHSAITVYLLLRSVLILLASVGTRHAGTPS